MKNPYAQITIGADKSIVPAFAWGQQDFMGNPVPSGRWYRIQAFDGRVGDAGRVVTNSVWLYIRPGD